MHSHELAPLIYDLATMLCVAALIVLVFQRIRQPIVLGYLVAGMFLGPYTPPYYLMNDIPNIKILSELGVIFLMFSLGLEFSFKKLTRVGFSASVTGLIEVILMIVIGYFTGKAMGWSHYDSLFLGAAISISSTMIIIKAIEELKLKTLPFAEHVFGVLIVEDLLAILILVALSTLVFTNRFISFEMLNETLKLIIVVGGWFLFGYFLLPPLFRKIGKYINQETLTITAVALCLGLTCIAVEFGYSAALGAFIMGSILAETIFGHRIERIIQPIKDIFAAVFFISVGMLIDPKIIFHHWGMVLIIIAVTIVGKIITATLGALLTGQSVNNSMRIGFSMAQVGEFSFIIAALGITLNVTSEILYPLIVAVAVITTFTTPYLIRISGKMSDLLERHLSKRSKFYLKTYSDWVLKLQKTSKKSSLYHKVIIRLILNGIMVAIIFTVLDQYLFTQIPFLAEDTTLPNTVSLLISLAVASPFIWGMLFSSRSKHSAKKFTPMVFVTWLMTLTEITILAFVLFDSWLTMLLFGVLAFIFFVFSFKQLEKSYEWFETQLVNNIIENGEASHLGGGKRKK